MHSTNLPRKCFCISLIQLFLKSINVFLKCFHCSLHQFWVSSSETPQCICKNPHMVVTSKLYSRLVSSSPYGKNFTTGKRWSFTLIWNVIFYPHNSLAWNIQEHLHWMHLQNLFEQWLVAHHFGVVVLCLMLFPGLLAFLTAAVGVCVPVDSISGGLYLMFCLCVSQ